MTIATVIAALVVGLVLGAVVVLLGVGVRENIHLAQLEAELGVTPDEPTKIEERWRAVRTAARRARGRL